MSWLVPAGSVLGILASRPDSGPAPQRPADTLDQGFTAGVSEAMLLDFAEEWSGDVHSADGGRKVLVYDPPDAGPWFDERVPEGLALQAQAEGDLGARLGAFFAGEFEDGASRVVVVGGDCPTLDPGFVISAFLLLEHKDVVLGPATDGGYYLVGLRAGVSGLFEGIPWNSPTVVDRTVERVLALGLSLAVLPPWYCVDDEDSWRMCVGHIRAMRAAGSLVRLPRLERLIPRLDRGPAR